MKFGDIVKREREKKEMSMQALADKANVGKTTIYNIEHNRHLPQISTRKLICDALGVKLKQVMSEVMQNE